MMRRAFDELGYRRYEWKCDSLNAPSWNAAERLGFRYEGIFRQAWVRYGRNRDNAWFSIIDREWPAMTIGAGTMARSGEFRHDRRATASAGRVHGRSAKEHGNER